MTIIEINGIPTRLKNVDVDGDGIVGGVETLQNNFDNNITPILQPSELEGSLRELNKDDIEQNSRQSAIDLRTRLGFFQVTSFSGYEFLVEVGMIPMSCISLTKQLKRNLVSLQGKGRDEIVELVAGKKQMEVQGGFMNQMKQGASNFMGMGGNK